jgi:hypothetical protein
MDKVRERASSLPQTRLPFGAGKVAYKTATSPPTRLGNWPRIAAIAALATAGAFVLGHVASLPVEKDGEVFTASEAPLPGFPPESHNAANNNMIARLGWVPDLDGTVVAYVGEADRLVEGGRFRTDISLDQMAAALMIIASSIANSRSPDEIDPDAELFRAHSGALTNESKESARALRRWRLTGKIPNRFVQEWVIKEFSFTLNRLKHPSDEENSVLSAIVRAASGIMPARGDKVRAEGMSRGAFENGPVKLSIGMLPSEKPMTGAGWDEERR